MQSRVVSKLWMRPMASCTSGALSFVELESTVGTPEYVGGRIQSRTMLRRP